MNIPLTFTGFSLFFAEGSTEGILGGEDQEEHAYGNVAD